MRILRTIRRQLAMPLLAKELVEQAARRRTYIVRIVYALCLFIYGAVMLYDQYYRHGNNLFQHLGRGEEIFLMLVAVQFLGIVVFMPALMCSAITSEKENNSLVLLMVTDLRPWQIIMQKYLGRLVPMLTFLLLSMPLMAVTYALGGVTTDRIASAILTLLLACLLTGALTLMLSAWCRSTGSAFVMSYFVGAIVCFGPIMIVGILKLWNLIDFYRNEEVLLSHIPPYVFFDKGRSFSSALAWSWPSAVLTLFFLVMARVFLVRRAFLTPKNVVLNVFRWFDKLFKNMNHLAGNVMLIKERDSLPGDDAIAWWEVTRRALGKPHYLFRISTVIMVPTLVIIAVMLAGGRQGWDAEPLTALLFIIWPIAALMLAVQGASTFTLDRARQTLDVLLTAPITTRQLVLEKTAALRRLIYVFFVPIFTIVGFEAWWEHGLSSSRYHNYTPWQHTTTFLICSALCAMIYLPMIAWLSLWIGMKIHHQTRAMISAVLVVAIWCVVPVFAVIVINIFTSLQQQYYLWLIMASPGSMIVMNEINEIDDMRAGIWPVITINFTFFCACCFWFRHMCLKRADRYLGRV